MSIETILIFILCTLICFLLVWQERNTDKDFERYMRLKRQKLVAGLKSYRPLRSIRKTESNSELRRKKKSS